jgi:hypothetical protein
VDSGISSTPRPGLAGRPVFQTPGDDDEVAVGFGSRATQSAFI